MKFAITLCLKYLLLCAECGLIKDIFGTVTDEVHKLTDGNVVVNTVTGIVQVKKGIISDFSNLINPNNYINQKKHDNTNSGQHQQQRNENNDYLVPVLKPTVNLNNIIQPISTNPIPIPDNRPLQSSTINTNKENNQLIQTIGLNKPIIYNNAVSEPYITEFGIEPRIARQITPENSEDNTDKKQNTFVEETNLNETNFNDKAYNVVINNENEMIMNNFDVPLNFSGIAETVEVEGCPEGFKMAPDGACEFFFDTSNGNETRSKGKNRANFSGGCLIGYAHGDDGTCQEVIYD